MKKIFTLLGGLLLASSLTVNAAEVVVYVSDENGNEIAYDFYANLTKDADGNFTLANLFGYTEGYGVPVSYKFNQPEVGGYSPIEITSNTTAIDGWDGYYYIKNNNDKYPVLWIYGLNGIDAYVKLRYSFIYLGSDGSSVYRYDTSNPNNQYDYFVTMMISGDFYGYNSETDDYDIELFTGEGEESPWLYVEFWFNDPSEANQEAYDKVIAEINAVENEYNVAVEAIKEVNPGFDFAEWEEIAKQIEDAKTNAGQALATANEELEDFNSIFPFSTEEIEAYITEMKRAGIPLEYPEEMNYTLNGETELPGVNVSQEFSYGTLSINVTGECDADEVVMEFATPQGWDSMIVLSELSGDFEYAKKVPVENGEYSWYPLEFGEEQGFKPGNSFTFPVNGEEQYGMIQLVKDEQIYWATIDITFEVAKSKSIDPELAAANQAAYEAVIAELDALQEKYEAAVEKIKNENPDFDFTEYEEIGIMIEQYKEWAAQALAAANIDGLEYQFEFDSNEFDAYITMMIMAAQVAPAFPEKFNITFNGKASLDLVEATQTYEQEVYTIKVSGLSFEDQVTVALAVPEGWDGFLSLDENDFYSPIEPLSTRTEETEWWPIEYMIEEGMKEGNTLTFPVDGEDHYGQFYLVKNGFADVANKISVEFNVSNPTVGVAGVETIDSNARYYDINGRQIAKPAAGMYIKVLNGKASKVIIK